MTDNENDKPQLHRLEIDRRTWLRGAKKPSCLRNSDGEQCCLGFACADAGVPPDDMLDILSPKRLPLPYHSEGNSLSQGLYGWLLQHIAAGFGYTSYCANSYAAEDLMGINDASELDDSEREAKIAAIFRRNGIEVVFTN